MAPLTRHKGALLGSLLILFVLGFATKFHGGLGSLWVSNHLGDILYEIFWCLFIAFCAPQMPIKKNVLLVFVITCFLEFLQLWHPPFLATLRNTFIGHAILGSHFDIWDIPHYALGCILAYVWLTKIPKRSSL